MQIKLKKHASRIEEAVQLCKMIAGDNSYEHMKKRIVDIYRFEVFDVQAILDRRIEIATAFIKEFQGKEDLLAHFFKPRSGNFFLADLLMYLPYLQTEKRKCRYVSDHEQNRSLAFVNAFLQMELIDETYTQSIQDFEGLSLLLEKIDIDREDKWLIQTTYLHLEDEMKRFVALINQVAEWLGRYEEMMCEEEATFCDYWQKVIEKKNFVEYLTDKLNMDISKKSNTLWVVPAFFACSTIAPKYQKDSVYVYIGMIFDESFSFEKKYETPELICGQLKLLSDPSKFEILCTIKEKPYYGSELAKKFNLSTPTISHHMRTLENAGFIRIEKKDNKTYYSLDHERLSLFLKQVQNMLLMTEE